MTSNSLFLRSLKSVFAVAPDRRQHSVRRHGLTPELAGLIEVVEDRCLLSGMAIDSELPPFTGGGPATGSGPSRVNPLTAIPRLNSHPGAPVNIYLDFNGHTETQDWPATREDGQTGPIVTPVFDIDDDLTTFSDEELRMIEEIWYRVSEDYAPFDVNVTTVDPGSFNNFQNVLVSIGGDGAWIGSPGGIAWLDSFNNNLVNTVYVFSDNTGKGSADHAKGTALAASHEVGHSLGLNHHSVYDSAGNLSAEYDPGRPDLGPIMGAPYNSERETWSSAPDNGGPTSIQDDFAIMTRSVNQTFKFRTDDYGDTRSAATALSVASSAISATGIVGTNADVDMFRFETNSGLISFNVKGLDLQSVYPAVTGVNRGTNLDAVLKLYDANGTTVVQSDLSTTLDATFSVTVSAGTYYVAVSSTGQYGAIGQYTLTGTVIPLPSTPTMLGPVGVMAQQFPLFEWTPGANAVSYQLQVDNLTTSQAGYYTSDVSGISHVAASRFAQGDYQARVRAVTGNGAFSEWSQYVSFTIDVPVPATPTVNRPTGDITDSLPTFGWSGDEFSKTYTLWVNNATTGTRVIYRTNYTDTSYVHFSALPDGIYRTWVRAFNSDGEASAWSEYAEFTVRSPVPIAPRITTPTAVSPNVSPRISWNAVNAAVKYDLWVDNLTTGTSKYIRQADISYTTPYYDAANLPQGTYRAWVRAANGNNQFSPWSDPYTFTIDILPPSTPTMVGPTGVNGIVTTTNPTFRWTAADRAATYDLWVNNVTTGQSQIIRRQDLSETEYVALTNLPQGLYHAWVRGINSVNEVGEWSARYTFTIDEPTPSIPVITAPAGNLAGSVSNTNPTFAWSSDLNVPFYEFVLDDQTDKKYNVIRVNNLQTTSYTVPVSQTLVEHTYVAWVRARNNSGETSNWSAPFQVRIDIPNPTAPTIISPTATSKDTTPTFQWTHTTGAIRYEILVRNLERGEDIVLQVTTFTLDPTGQFSIYTLPNDKALDPGTYRFWIRSFNSLGTASNWSSSRTFVISASLDVKDLKLVEPSRLLTAEKFYAIADENLQASGNDPETDYTAKATEVSVSVPTRAAVPAASDAVMLPTLIEEVMESLSDPASPASAMLSGSISSDSVAEPTDTSRRTMAAAVFAVTMLPVRRRRREESR